MSQFSYTLPSGAEFIVRGPAGATQPQADRIFYEQVAAGSLVGYEAGQTLSSVATKITKFELSRLDRGTAGVDNAPVLAIVQGLPVITGIPSLTNITLSNPINEADIVDIKGDDLAPESVGPLSSFQTQKLLAQIANLVDQESDQISLDKGIGRYGFTAYALEEAGYVKPGTSLRFFAVNSEDFISVMSSPSVWTGKDGVYGLNDLLSDPLLQNRAQVSIMQQGYAGLLESGTITAPATSGISVNSGQVYTNGGLQSIQALIGGSLIGSLGRLSSAGLINGITQNAQTAGTTLNRLLNGSNINLATIGSGAVNSLTAGLGNLGNLASVNFASLGAGLTNQITGGVGALVTNASKFGTDATALWARAGGVNLTNLAGGLTGNLNGLTSNLTNLVPGSLSNLTSSLDVFGKAGSFATNFANPLGNLNTLTNIGGLSGALTGQLGSLQGALTGQLGSLQGALTGQLGALSGQLNGALGSLGSLGSFANIGAVGDLFGGGGDLVSGTAVAGGFNNTVNRSTLDAAFARVVGSNKVPLPTFQYPSPAALGPRLDIQQAFNFLKNQTNTAGTTFGQTVTI